MSRGRIAAALLATGLLASGCGDSNPISPPARPAAGDAVAQIAAEEDQWSRDYAAHDLDRLVAHYAPDATLKAPGVPLLAGRWIRSALRATLNDPAFAIAFTHDRIIVARSGDLAYSRGHYRQTETDRQTGQPKTEYGTYLTVWQKQADGSWKVLEDFATPGPPPAPHL